MERLQKKELELVNASPEEQRVASKVQGVPETAEQALGAEWQLAIESKQKRPAEFGNAPRGI